MSQRTGEVLIVLFIILLNVLLLMGSPGGRQIDYQETQYESR